MAPLTIYLAKLLGLFSLIFALGMMANKKDMVAAVRGMLSSPPILLIIDTLAIGVGLAMVLGHNVWSGGALPVVVTLVGWASLLKGLVFLALPSERTVRLYEGLHYEKRFFVFTGISLVLGLYLTIAGFTAR
jgi:hypothetical protein